MGDPLIHLICGSTGAGKTTQALALTDRLKGVRFSIDEWMNALFWPDSPHPLEGAWSMARVERCHDQIWAVSRQVATRGVPCVLDLGFSQAASRARFADLARSAGLTVRLWFVDVSADQRWRRVQARNAGQDETRQLDFEITREMFDFVDSIWEPPSEAEMRVMDGVRLT